MIFGNSRLPRLRWTAIDRQSPTIDIVVPKAMPLEDTDHDTNEDIDERRPLLNGVAIPPKPPSELANVASSGRTSLKLVLPALMLCAFLAAFDVTVVAAIYPIM